MILPDVNVLLYAFREDAARHAEYREWLLDAVSGHQAFGVAELVLSGFVRIATHPRVFDPPTPLEAALGFVSALHSRPNCVVLAPGARHWDIFLHLCRTAECRGNLVADAYLAALAIETGSEWVTTDRDYSRFPGLAWRHPLVSSAT